MSEIIAIVVFLAGLTGMAVIFLRRLPELASLPRTTPVFKLRKKLFPELWTRAKKKIGDFPFFKDFSAEVFLQKILSKFWVVALRTENKIAVWLTVLRQKSQKSQRLKDDQSYWDKLQNNK